MASSTYNEAVKVYGANFDRYDEDGYWEDDYRRRYDLPRLPNGESYYRIGDNFLRVDDETRLVLELIDVLAGSSN